MKRHASASLLNVTGLVAGFAAGQGSLFAAQTYLLIDAHPGLLASLGVALAAITLSYQLTDFGGIVLIARDTARGDHHGTLGSVFAVRTLVAIFTSTTLLLVGVPLRAAEPLISGALIGGSAGLLPWAFNLTGFLDGIGRSGVSGITASIPWIAAAVAIFSGPLDDLFRAGLTVGLAFSVGSMLAVAVHLLLRRRLAAFELGRPQRILMIRCLREGGTYCVSWLPGQVYARLQIVLAAVALDPALAAAFVYVKQLLNAGSQLVLFVRRVEFPRLAVLAAGSSTALRELLRTQATSVLASVALAALILVAAEMASRIANAQFGTVAMLVRLLVVTLPAAGVASAFGQILLAQGRMAVYSSMIYLSLTIAVLTLIGSLDSLGVTALLLAELVLSGTQVLGYLRFLRRRDAVATI